MKKGKHVCDQLKQVRLDIARANGIDYAPRECHHEGDCSGTCPACESELRYLEREIARRRANAKAALVAGVSLGLMSFTAMSCNQQNKADDDVLQGEVEFVGDSCAVADSIGHDNTESGEIVDVTDGLKGKAVHTLGGIDHVDAYGTASHGVNDE
jgi:hypothetical protein